VDPHLVEEAAQADRVLVLHQGKLLADGTPGEVLAALGGGTASKNPSSAPPTERPVTMTPMRRRTIAAALLAVALAAHADGVAFVSREKDNALVALDMKTLTVTRGELFTRESPKSPPRVRTRRDVCQ
jgi:ABC-type multidrug transport system ATPase subunit